MLLCSFGDQIRRVDTTGVGFEAFGYPTASVCKFCKCIISTDGRLTKGAAVGACSGWMPKQKPERRPDSVPVSTGFYHRYIYICIYVYMYIYIYVYRVVSCCIHMFPPFRKTPSPIRFSPCLDPQTLTIGSHLVCELFHLLAVLWRPLMAVCSGLNSHWLPIVYHYR